MRGVATVRHLSFFFPFLEVVPVGKLIRFPFVDETGKVDFPAVLGFVVATAAAIWIAKKLPILKKAV